MNPTTVHVLLIVGFTCVCEVGYSRVPVDELGCCGMTPLYEHVLALLQNEHLQSVGKSRQGFPYSLPRVCTAFSAFLISPNRCATYYRDDWHRETPGCSLLWRLAVGGWPLGVGRWPLPVPRPLWDNAKRTATVTVASVRYSRQPMLRDASCRRGVSSWIESTNNPSLQNKA